MAGDWDANVKLLSAVEVGTTFELNDVANADAFEVIADVEIGESLNEVVDDFVLRVAVVNLTQLQVVQIVDFPGNLTATKNATFQNTERVPFNAPNQAVGDVLQAVASYRVNAGANVDFSTAESNTFVVS